MVHINSPNTQPGWFTAAEWITSHLNQFLFESAKFQTVLLFQFWLISSFSPNASWKMSICPASWINPIVCKDGWLVFKISHFQSVLYTNLHECTDQIQCDNGTDFILKHRSVSLSFLVFLLTVSTYSRVSFGFGGFFSKMGLFVITAVYSKTRANIHACLAIV